MHERKIKVILKSGVELGAVIKTDIENSLEVAKELFTEDKPNQITSIEDKEAGKTLFFRIDEVAAFEIIRK